MPIYEYECQGCRSVFEVTQKISDPPLKKHAACGSKKVKKLISMTSFQLKGEGWYVTDYKKKPVEATEPKAETKVDAKPEVKTDAKTEAKTEAKPEAKSEPTEPKSSPSRRKPSKPSAPSKKKSKGRAA